MHKITILFILFVTSVMLHAQQDTKYFFFIHATDPQFGFIENNKGFAGEAALMYKAVEIINTLRPDFVVFTGDHVHDPYSAAQIEEFKKILAQVNNEIPVYLVPGNHDIPDANNQTQVEQYIATYGSDRFFFTHKQVQFLGINSCYLKDDALQYEDSQFRWMQDALKAQNGNQLRTFVFMHHPLFLETPDEADSHANILLDKRKRYIRFFKENNVKAVFSGHLHYPLHAKDGSLDFFTAGAVGRVLGNGYHGMNLVKVSPETHECTYISLEDFPTKIDCMKQ